MKVVRKSNDLKVIWNEHLCVQDFAIVSPVCHLSNRAVVFFANWWIVPKGEIECSEAVALGAIDFNYVYES